MKRLIFLLSVIASMFLVSAAVAAVTVTYNTGTVQTTTALTGFTTSGAMMDGMTVQATFATGGTETAIWADTGPDSGGATGAHFSLTESGNTFGGIWNLSVAGLGGITSLTIDAGTGDSVFDTTAIGDIGGTIGSERGWSFAVTDLFGFNGNIAATYFNAVQLTGDAPVGDLFRNINIAFSAPLTDQLAYITDTDNLQFAGDIQPVPEPGTMMLLGSGLAGLVGYGRKRFRK